MIKNLKTKFILLAMISMFLLLALITVSANILNRNMVIGHADTALDMLNEKTDITEEKKEPSTTDDKNKDGRPEKRQKPDEKDKTETSRYRDRIMLDEYYFVLLSPDGEFIRADVEHAPWLTEERAAEYAKKAYAEGKSRNNMGVFRYAVQEKNSNVLITVLNMDREFSAMYHFLLSSLLIGALGYIAISIVIIFSASKLVRPIDESYRKQKRFITNAGHELKTPLTVISTNVELMKMEIGENEFLDEIKHQTERLGEMTNNLVYLSRLEEGEKLTVSEFPISDIINETVLCFAGTAQAQEKIYEYDIEPDISYKGNSRSIERLASILLENAMKYSPKNGRISIMLKKQGKHLIFKVFNNSSIPIYEEDTERIFERFYRTDSTQGRDIKGHGIGLSMAKAIVDAHNGKIWAQAEDPYSFTITVQLPVK